MNYVLIDDLLKEMGMSRRQLAIKCGIAPGTMSNWFARKTKKIPLESLLKMERVLEVPWQEIQGIENEVVENVVIDGKERKIHLRSSDHEGRLLDSFYKLNRNGQEKVIDYADTLSKVPEYQVKNE